MKQPPFLRKGNKVGIVIPAGKIDKKYIQNAEVVLSAWDLKLSFIQEIISSDNSFSDTDTKRALALQQMLDDSEIKAIFCARGGYGTIRIIDRLNFDAFVKSPKWIIGFSDITILHSLLNNKYQIQSLHAVMPLNYPEQGQINDSLMSLKNALFGKTVSYSFPSHTMNNQGISEGVLIGGNLSVLHSLRGTDIDIKSENKILFIEDVGEYMYHIDRMLMNFQRGGFFQNIKGLIIGGMSDIKDEKFIVKKSLNELIYEKVKNFNYPVVFNFNAGHIPINLALFMGGNVKINVLETQTTLSFVN